MRVTILGSGTSSGVPVIACDCSVCTSNSPRNQRLRASIYVEWDGMSLLVDSGPDLRQQALRANLRQIDAVLYTHDHADHIYGLDELRVFSHRQKNVLPCFGSPVTLERLRRSFSYVFANSDAPGWRPRLELRAVEGRFSIGEKSIVPIPVEHGHEEVLAFRFGDFSYVTDCSAIPEESFRLLEGTDVLILDALRYRNHPKHLSFAQALELIERLAPREAYLTHINHEVDHEALEIDLPPHVRLCYDGLVLELD